MPPDPITDARNTIAEQEKIIRSAEESQRLKSELGHLVRELENLPADATVVVTVRSPATGKERLVTLPKEATAGLLELVGDEVARLEGGDASRV